MSDRHRSDSPLPCEAMIKRLTTGLENLQQSLAAGQIETVLDYLAELARWNTAYNLTAVTDPLEMVDRHVIDSLSLRPFLTGKEIVDSGTGAGLPGLVLAIAEPQRHFVLVDSNGKKIRFLRHMARTLGVENIEPVQARLESIELERAPDEIVARALAPLARLVEWHAPWLAGGARLLAMKGRLEESERAAVPDAYNVDLHTLEHAGRDGEARSLAIVTISVTTSVTSSVTTSGTTIAT